MIGHIYIQRQIGNSYDENGNITEKGVELQDVIMQVEANKDAQALYFHITSPGGCVRVGKLIADYIAKLPNAWTIAEDFCASMGTEIHLAVPVERRKILAGTEYFIHNPLLVGVSGNADELEQAAAEIRPIEKEMLSMYVKATGADRAAIEGLMKQETGLTDEQCKALGFVSEILPKVELKAIAFINKNKENKENSFNMENKVEEVIAKFETRLTETMQSLGLAKKPEVKAMVIDTDKGQLSFESEGDMPVVGEMVMIDGEPAPEGDYLTESGWTIKVDAEGMVAELVEPEGAEANEETLESLKEKIAEMEASYEQREEELVDTMTASFEAKLEEIKDLGGSSFTPKVEAKNFKNRGQKNKVSLKDEAKARRAEIKKAKEEEK